MQTIGLSNQTPQVKRWRVTKTMVVLCLAVAAIPLLFVVVVTILPAPLFSSIESPDKTYVVNLRGKESSPTFPLIMHRVYVDLYRRGTPVVRGKALHDGDWFDPGFDDLYSDHTWLNSSVLMFRRGKLGERGLDTLNITNNTSKPIKFLRVESVEMFLLLDLQPRARTKLSASPQTWLSWLEVDGEFEDGKSIPWKGVNFTIDRNVKGPFTYEIVINDDGPTISSSQLPVYRPEE